MGDNKINILAGDGGRDGGAADDLGGGDGGDGMQYCIEHPYRGASPGGICALCLQEKLGKLVSSSKHSTPFLSPQINSSSSSSPSFRSSSSSISNAAAPLPPPPPPPPITTYSNSTRSRRSHNRISSYFISPSAHRKNRISGAHKLDKDHTSAATAVSTTATAQAALTRSKSVAPRPAVGEALMMDSPRKKSFWSFLSLTSASSSSSSNNKPKTSSSAVESYNGLARSHDAMAETPRRDPAMVVVIEDEDSQLSTSSSFGRKVSRSRSVGCGSRSFSGDFLERLSTGFGDCTLRRVESQRESNKKTSTTSASSRIHHHHQQGGTMKERVKCGGIFGGFGMIYSTSSSYWLSAAAGDEDDNGEASSGGPNASTPHARSRIWSWTFASPMRAFTRPSPKPTTSGTIHASCHKTPTGGVIAATSIGGDRAVRMENRNGSRIDGVPSLLAVGG